MILALISSLGGLGLIAVIALKALGVSGTLEKLRAARAALTHVPKWVYIALGSILVILLAIWWHGNKVEAFEKAIRADEQAKIAAKAREIEAKANALSAKSRTLSDETNRRIDDRARTVLVHGPGRAACVGAVPTTPGGHDEASGTGTAALPRVPYPEWQQLLGVPFPSAVEFARLCDANRAEALTWRDWYAAQEALHSKK